MLPRTARTEKRFDATQDAVVKPGWIPLAGFLAGYGAAQAVPASVFALSAYLAARLPASDGVC